MKKKYRDIVVNKIKYAWMFKRHNDCDYLSIGILKIWKSKKIIFEKEYFEKDFIQDFPSGHVLPSDIVKIIKENHARTGI